MFVLCLRKLHSEIGYQLLLPFLLHYIRGSKPLLPSVPSQKFITELLNDTIKCHCEERKRRGNLMLCNALLSL
jgi:hypothetical protein